MSAATPLLRPALLALALVVSGVPAVALDLAGSPPAACEDDCDGALPGEDCGPVCQVGTCAKVFAADVAAADEPSEPRLESAAVAPVPAVQSLWRGDGNFHPPRV